MLVFLIEEKRNFNIFKKRLKPIEIKDDKIILNCKIEKYKINKKIKLVKKITKILNKNAANYEYLISSKNSYPEPEDLITEFERSGFKFIKEQDFLFGAVSCQIMRK